MAKKTKYRVVVTEPAFPGGSYTITRTSAHDDYKYVWLVWGVDRLKAAHEDLKHSLPQVGFSRTQEQAFTTAQSVRRHYGDGTYLVVQNITTQDRS